MLNIIFIIFFFIAVCIIIFTDDTSCYSSSDKATYRVPTEHFLDDKYLLHRYSNSLQNIGDETHAKVKSSTIRKKRRVNTKRISRDFEDIPLKVIRGKR